MSRRRIIQWVLPLAVIACALIGWLQWARWPDPRPVPLPWQPEAIVILGGGNEDRVRQGKLLADLYPNLPVIVTGDGGVIVRGLDEMGLPSARIIHEPMATSTFGNARQTAPLLEYQHARRVALVTNWFHVPRALATFRHVQPEREFVASFEARPGPITMWEKAAQRRERLAAVGYWLRYGVWSW